MPEAAPRLSDSELQILRGMCGGFRLVGPVTRRDGRPGNWGLADRSAETGPHGPRAYTPANAHSVRALASAGLIAIEERPDGREARLAWEAQNG